MTKPDYDICVIGGGINGAGIARDAAGRGLSVLLVEAQDLAGATSSASTKLIHGGLRYLEYYAFRLVHESLRERERLLKLAPHIIHPLQFVLPHDESLRPAWMIRAGLFLYDHMGGRQKLTPSRQHNLRSIDIGNPLNDKFKIGFSYADCWVDDARLVILNALSAAEKGARVMTRTACIRIDAAEDGQSWNLSLRNLSTGHEAVITAKTVINAAGPWVRAVLETSNLANALTPKIRLVKGSHIVVPKIHDGAQAYILQQQDRRIVFAIPYETHYTLIGTTEIDFDAETALPEIDAAEINYLVAAANAAFHKQISMHDIVWTYSGVRPLIDDGKASATATTRDYSLVVDRGHGPIILSVFGGKITTYRRLAEQAVETLLREAHLSPRRRWSAREPLPGGDIPCGNMEAFLRRQKRLYPWLEDHLIQRYAKTYGTRMDWLLSGHVAMEELGTHYGDGIYEAEIQYLTEHEWARTIEDVLWRRTKMGLHITEKTLHNLGHSPLLRKS